MSSFTDLGQLSAALVKLSDQEVQEFVDYLSSRLRALAQITFNLQVPEGNNLGLLKTLPESIREELSNVVSVVGLAKALGHTVVTPPYLIKCMHKSLHLSKRYDDYSPDDRDNIENGLGDQWYLNLKDRPHPDPMLDVLNKWGRKKLHEGFAEELDVSLLSNNLLRNTLQIYTRLREEIELEIDQLRGEIRGNEAKCAILGSLLVDAQRTYRNAKVREQVLDDLGRMFESDGESMDGIEEDSKKVGGTVDENTKKVGGTVNYLPWSKLAEVPSPVPGQTVTESSPVPVVTASLKDPRVPPVSASLKVPRVPSVSASSMKRPPVTVSSVRAPPSADVSSVRSTPANVSSVKPPPSAIPLSVKSPSATLSSSSVKPPFAIPSSSSVLPPSATPSSEKPSPSAAASSTKHPVRAIMASSMKRPRRSIAASPLKPLPACASTASSDSSDSDIEFVDGPAVGSTLIPEIQIASEPHVPKVVKVLTNMKYTEHPSRRKSGQAISVDETTSSSSSSSEEDQLDDTILVDALGSSGAFPKKRDPMPGPEDDVLDDGV